MDKICRGSSVGRLHLESPRVMAAGMSNPASPSPGLRTCRSERFFHEGSVMRSVSQPAREDAYLLPAAGVPSPERPMPRLPTGPKRESRSEKPVPRLGSEEIKTPRTTAWFVGKGLEGVAQDSFAPMFSPNIRCRPINTIGTTASVLLAASPPPQVQSNITAGVVDGNPMLPFGMARGRSEHWLMTPRMRTQEPMGSPRVAPVMSLRDFSEAQKPSELHFGNLASTGSGRTAVSASPRMDYRAMSPTFRTSTDFCLATSTVNPDREPEPGSPYYAKRDRLADNPFSDRRMRKHVGKITENSDRLIEHDEDNMAPMKTVITNAEDFKISRGKKVGYGRESTEAAGRFKLDTEQQEPTRTQRKHEFGSPQNEWPETVASGSPTPVATPRQVRISQQPPSWSPGRVSRPSRSSITPQLQSSPEMNGAMKPDMTPASPQKYFVGDEIVEHHRYGRRSLTDVARFAGLPQPQQPLPAGQVPQLSPAADCQPSPRETPLTPHDQRSSELIRSHLTAPQHALTLSASVPVVYASSPAKNIAAKTAGSMGSSMVPSSVSKDAAYLQSGVTVVRHIPRTPGQFSPNLTRTPVRQVIHL